jgi:hypothetical protein
MSQNLKEIYYPKSRRRKVIDHHGNVISDTKDKRMTLVFSEEHRRKMSLAKLGAKQPLWKGDQVGYGSLHEWVKNHKLRPELCEDCDESPVKDLANITGVYNRDFSNWKYLCHKCHMIRDNTIDMSDRRCSECNSPNTYFKSNGRPD